MERKLLCFDLDDTLLRNDKTISKTTISILQEWKKQGGLIAFATARNKERVEAYAKDVKIDGLVALMGAFIYQNDQLVERDCIDSKFVKKLQKACTEHGDCYMSVFLENQILTNFQPFLSHGDCTYCDYQKTPLKDVGKILFLSESYMKGELWEDLQSYRYTQDAIYHSYTISPKLANKINGIQILCNHLDVEMKNTYCFGNDDSDIEMLQGAGVGVAVQNSSDALKVMADDICLSNEEDGPALWVKKHLL